MKLSIIVPVFQVEDYIRPCMESIFSQGLDDSDFEVIIVDDGTKDRSIDIIQDIISLHQNIRLIRQENLGLSVARNNGMAVAQGEYLLMPDSDDLLVEGSLKPLLDTALETKAELVVADFLSINDEEMESLLETGIQQPPFKCAEKTGEELLLQDLDPYHCYVWCTLYRKDFIREHRLSFVPDVYYQDVPFTHECYLKAKRAIKCTRLLNIYRRRPGAATYSFDERKGRDFCTVIAKTWELRQMAGLTPPVRQKLEDDVWVTFSIMTRLMCHQIDSRQARNAIFDFLKQEAPDIDFRHGWRQRLNNWLYHHMPHTYIRLKRAYILNFEERLRPFLMRLFRH